MNNVKKWLGAAVIIFTAGGVMAQGVPYLVNYQGRLLDSGGQPVNDPALPMDFSVWDKAVTVESVTDEQVLMEGTTVQPLARQNLAPGSEVVTAVGGVPPYSTPNDYLIDYANGTITRVPTGFILDGLQEFQRIRDAPDYVTCYDNRLTALCCGLFHNTRIKL